MKLKIGYFEFLPEFLETKKNLSSIKELLQKNKREIENWDLIVFPEYFLSGPLKIDFIKKYEKEQSSEEIINNLKEVTKDFPETTFVMGSVLLKENDNYFNTSMAMRDGEILAKYYKKALIYNENYICKSNDKPAVFKVGELNIGLTICWDLILPEIYRTYVDKIDLMVVPSFWGIGGNKLQAKYSFSLEKKYYTALGVSRAYENAFALLFVNSVGKYESDFYSDRMMGRSYFVNPPLGIIHRLNNKDPEKLLSIDFDTKPLKQYREFYATHKDYFYYKDKGVI